MYGRPDTYCLPEKGHSLLLLAWELPMIMIMRLPAIRLSVLSFHSELPYPRMHGIIDHFPSQLTFRTILDKVATAWHAVLRFIGPPNPAAQAG